MSRRLSDEARESKFLRIPESPMPSHLKASPLMEVECGWWTAPRSDGNGWGRARKSFAPDRWAIESPPTKNLELMSAQDRRRFAYPVRTGNCCLLLPSESWFGHDSTEEVSLQLRLDCCGSLEP